MASAEAFLAAISSAKLYAPAAHLSRPDEEREMKKEKEREQEQDTEKEQAKEKEAAKVKAKSALSDASAVARLAGRRVQVRHFRAFGLFTSRSRWSRSSRQNQPVRACSSKLGLLGLLGRRADLQTYSYLAAPFSAALNTRNAFISPRIHNFPRSLFLFPSQRAPFLFQKWRVPSGLQKWCYIPRIDLQNYVKSHTRSTPPSDIRPI